MPQDPQAMLDELLSETAAQAIRRAQGAFDQAIGPARRFVLFGAGRMGRKVLAGMRRLGLDVAAWSDNATALWGSQLEGLEVLSPQEAARRFGQSSAFIVTIFRAEGGHFYPDTERTLKELGCRYVLFFVPLFWKYPQTFLPYYNVDLPHRVIEAAGEIRNAMTLWSDEESRRHFVSQLLWLLKGDVSNLPPPMDCEPYFPPGLFGPLDSETFVDCGAFTGDTLRGVVERLHWPFRAYHALEPDPASFQALRHFVDGLAPGLRDRIVLHPVAASDRCRKVRFSGGGTMDASFDQNGAEEVQCVRMDDELAGLAVTMIKIDTEGAEREALCGAEQIIRQRRPILAVSAYHRQGDLWQLPLLIRSFGDDYRFYLHPHGYDSFDLVLYAIPRERAIHAR